MRKQKHIVRIHTYRSLYYQILHRETLKSTLIIITQYYLSDKIIQNKMKIDVYMEIYLYLMFFYVFHGAIAAHCL